MRILSIAIFSLAVVASAPSVAAECGPLQSLTTIDTLAGPNGSMLVPVRINDSPRVLLFDTGGAMTGISEPVANELNLLAYSSNTRLRGITGATSDRYTVVPSLTIGRLVLKSERLMILPGNRPMFGDNRVAGILAPNPTLDVDLDFAAHRVRFISPDHCPGHVLYWDAAVAAAIPMRIAQIGHIIIPVTLDGKEMEAVIDTGAVRTSLNMGVARTRFGIDRDSPGVARGGEVNGTSGVIFYQRRFSTLSFQGVAVANPLINLIPDRITFQLPEPVGVENRIRQAESLPPDLLIGMDVLSKLHLYIAYKERKLYVTAASPTQ